jgi:predicted SprT family Zn-dependent metalloprotease
MWVAASRDSWNAFNEISPDGSLNYDDTMALTYDNSTIDSFIIAINCKLWLEGSRDQIIYFYVHELIHYIASQEQNGDSDHNHLREKYWGAKGLFEQLLNALQCDYRQ